MTKRRFSWLVFCLKMSDLCYNFIYLYAMYIVYVHFALGGFSALRELPREQMLFWTASLRNERNSASKAVSSSSYTVRWCSIKSDKGVVSKVSAYASNKHITSTWETGVCVLCGTKNQYYDCKLVILTQTFTVRPTIPTPRSYSKHSFWKYQYRTIFFWQIGLHGF